MKQVFLCGVTILRRQCSTESWLYLETVIKYSDFIDFFQNLKWLPLNVKGIAAP